MKKLYYFGCIGKPGHHFYLNDTCRIRPEVVDIPRLNQAVLNSIGSFPPKDRSDGYYNECTVPPVKIVAWWDNSVDKRPGSRSVLIGYGYASAEEMINDAYDRFPSVMKRQLRPKPANIPCG